MHLYNIKGRIQKYDDIESIIKEYYEIRLLYYEKRKAYILQVLSKQLNLLSYKVKFILMIVNNEININNKSKNEIEQILEYHKFPKLEKNTKNIDSNSNFEDDKKSYEYLLSMPLYNLTKEKIDELNKQHQDKESEYKNLYEKTSQNLYLEELELLKNKYIIWLNNK